MLLSYITSWIGGSMPGKVRVSQIAKELGITAKEAVEWLNTNGEYTKSAASTIEEPAVRKLRQHFPGSAGAQPRRATPLAARPRNNPFMDLGMPDEREAGRQIPERPRQDPLIRPAVRPASLPPLPPQHNPFRTSAPRQQPYFVPPNYTTKSRPGPFKGEPSVVATVLLRVMLRNGDLQDRRPMRPAMWWTDEVTNAERLASPWIGTMLDAGFTVGDIEDWALALGVAAHRTSQADPVEWAIRLASLGVAAEEARWRTSGVNLPIGERLMTGNIGIKSALLMIDHERQLRAS
jgi:hypothetical protein